MVTKCDRLARSLPDARAIADELTARQVRLSLGASVYDPNDPTVREAALHLGPSGHRNRGPSSKALASIPIAITITIAIGTLCASPPFV